MKVSNLIVIFTSVLFSTFSQASTLVINPTSDGSIYTCAGCNNTVSDGGYVLADGPIQGVVKFSTLSISGEVINAQLSLNPYGLPLYGPTVGVYGYGTSIAALDSSDAFAGTFLGNITLPQTISYGEDIYFDVTSFVANSTAPYLAFNLRASGSNVFSSLEFNYDHPSQLAVTTTPLPPSLVLFSLGLMMLIPAQLKRKFS